MYKKKHISFQFLCKTEGKSAERASRFFSQHKLDHENTSVLIWNDKKQS